MKVSLFALWFNLAFTCFCLLQHYWGYALWYGVWTFIWLYFWENYDKPRQRP